MNKKKWMNIYNSLLRLCFHQYINQAKPEVIEEFDSHYQNFIDKHWSNPNKEKVRFFGGDMLLGMAYLTLHRTVEFTKSDLTCSEAEEVLAIKNWNVLNIRTYSDFITYYGIDVVYLAETKSNNSPLYSSESEKLEFFIKKIRNSVGHYNYEIIGIDAIRFFDVLPNNGTKQMECVFNYSQFLRFCIEYVSIVNDVLRKLNPV